MRVFVALLLAVVFAACKSAPMDAGLEIVYPRRSTRVVELYPLICFSLQTHLSCPVGTQTMTSKDEENAGLFDRQFQRFFAPEKELAEFLCMPSNARARHLLKRVARGEIINDVRTTESKWAKQEVEMSLHIEVVKKCVRKQ
ncbi:hypothetical protein M3Y99_01501600 [Aphelenchoides fujianensis]|nr:hypothetical protein M3Y99_01501600 [Aphelenchoides fujianensis]